MTERASRESAGILKRLQRQIALAGPPQEQAAVGTAPQIWTVRILEIPLQDLASLRAEVETAASGHRDVGQINPRPPGLHNRLIQFVKKLMRRSLTWYTRPLHVFQGGVIRALQQVASFLEGQQTVSSTFAQEFNSLSKQVARTDQTAAEAREELVNRIAGVRSELLDQVSRIHSDLSAQIMDSKRDLSAQIMDSKRDFSAQIMDSKGDFSAQIMDSKRDFSAQIMDSKSDLLRQISSTKDELSARVDGVSSHNEQRLEQFRILIDEQCEEFNRDRNELLTVVRQQRIRERDVRRFVNSVERGEITLPSEPEPPVSPMFASELKNQDEFDYFVFEDKFRGSEALIRTRQQEYLEYFRGRDNVVDVGCGRGEFLELLRDNGIAARGIELGIDQFLLCREKGLDVVRSDLFAFLESLPESSIGGLFSAQVIEHLTASDQLRFVALAYRKSKPGSPVIFETINAECVFAIVRNFFLDPTHVRPVHPETLKFAMESVHFQDVTLKFMAPLVQRHIPPLHIGDASEQVEKFNSAIRQLNELIYGCQDYAAIGWH